MRIAIVSSLVAVAWLANPQPVDADEARCDRACDRIAALRDAVAPHLAGIDGHQGMVNHLDQAVRGCLRGNFSLAIAGLESFEHQVQGKAPRGVSPADADRISAAVAELVAHLRSLAAGGPCLAALGQLGLFATCPLAGVAGPFADDFDDGVVDPVRWRDQSSPPATAAVIERDGALYTATGAQAPGTITWAGLGAACAYPPQDYLASVEVLVPGGNAGDYIFLADAGTGAVHGQSISGVGSGYALSHFPPGEGGPVPCEPPVSLGFDTWLTVQMAFVLDDGSGRPALTGEVWAGGARLCSATHRFATDPTELRLFVGVTAQRGGDVPTAIATDAVIAWDDFSTTLVDPIAEFVGVVAPLALGGTAYDAAATLYLYDGRLTALTAPAVVAGVDGARNLGAALIDLDGDGSTRVTLYTDLAVAPLTSWLAVEAPAAVLDAFVPDVLLATGPGSDYAVAPVVLRSP